MQSDRAAAYWYVRQCVFSAIEEAEVSEVTDTVSDPFTTFTSKLAIVSYDLEYGIRLCLSFREILNEIQHIVRVSEVRAITVRWSGEQALYRILNHFTEVFRGCVVDGVLLPIEQQNE